MADILVLEDQRLAFDGLAYNFGRLSIDIVTNSRDFKEYVDEGNMPKLWFLDERVPEEPYVAGGDLPCFVQNCSYLLEKVPDAKVYCISRFPGQDTRIYAKEHGIGFAEKDKIPEVFRKEFPRFPIQK